MRVSKTDVVFVGAARTAIGSYGGSLKDHSACDLATLVVKEAFALAGVEPARRSDRAGQRSAQ